ncbi:MAG: tyrosine-protein phosphatase [Lachnospiraceae bacterium]|nr:tyrosine-protein phosphatase [Lachnospiraceae bacterium]
MKHQRRILLENANNFRDLGGYPAADGKTTCWGKLFRTESLRYLSGADWKTLETLGVKTLIDLRGEPEARERPVNAPESFIYRNLPFINRQRFLEAGKSGDNSMLISLIMRYSVIYENSPEQVAKVLEEILAGLDRGAVAFFCTGGKDRTGMTAATILALCGVPDDDIVTDYMVTEVYDASPERGVYGKLSSDRLVIPRESEKNEDKLRSKAETMRSFLEYLHGMDLRAFLNDHGFSYEAQNNLIGMMVE